MEKVKKKVSIHLLTRNKYLYLFEINYLCVNFLVQINGDFVCLFVWTTDTFEVYFGWLQSDGWFWTIFNANGKSEKILPLGPHHWWS